MAKEKEIKIPNKTTMNLYQVDKKGNSVPGFVIGLVAVGVVCILVAQFGVINRLNKLNAMQSEINAIQSQLNEYQAEMAEYPKVKEDYLRYSDAYSRDSIVYVSRIRIMNMLEDACADLGTLVSYSISNNTITVKVNTKTLEDFDKIKMNLDSNKYVTSVTPMSHDDQTVSGVVVNAFRFDVKEVDE